MLNTFINCYIQILTIDWEKNEKESGKALPTMFAFQPLKNNTSCLGYYLILFNLATKFGNHVKQAYFHG